MPVDQAAVQAALHTHGHLRPPPAAVSAQRLSLRPTAGACSGAEAEEEDAASARSTPTSYIPPADVCHASVVLLSSDARAAAAELAALTAGDALELAAVRSPRRTLRTAALLPWLPSTQSVHTSTATHLVADAFLGGWFPHVGTHGGHAHARAARFFPPPCRRAPTPPLAQRAGGCALRPRCRHHMPGSPGRCGQHPARRGGASRSGTNAAGDALLADARGARRAPRSGGGGGGR